MIGSARRRIGSRRSRSRRMLAGDALVGAQRMRTARFAEAADQRRIVGFQEQQPRGNLAADALEQRRKAFQRRAFANIHHQRRAADVGRVAWPARRTSGSGRSADCRPSSSPDPPDALSTVPLPEPLMPVMITSSVVAHGVAPDSWASQASGPSAQDSIRSKWPSRRRTSTDRHCLVRVAIDHVVALVVHFEHRLFQRHGLALS